MNKIGFFWNNFYKKPLYFGKQVGEGHMNFNMSFWNFSETVPYNYVLYLRKKAKDLGIKARLGYFWNNNFQNNTPLRWGLLLDEFDIDGSERYILFGNEASSFYESFSETVPKEYIEHLQFLQPTHSLDRPYSFNEFLVNRRQKEGTTSIEIIFNENDLNFDFILDGERLTTKKYQSKEDFLVDYPMFKKYVQINEQQIHI